VSNWLVHHDRILTAYRFGHEANPLPDLARQSLIRRVIMGTLLLIPSYAKHIANLHAQYADSPFSPYISLTTDIDALLDTRDWGLASIVTGYPEPAIQAPFLFTYQIPESKLIYPNYDMVGASRIEKEVLYRGKNIVEFLIKEQPNPFKPGDARHFKPASS
jgi:hypothetical protein